MECDPTRMCERLVGLGDVEVLGVDDEAGSRWGSTSAGEVPSPTAGTVALCCGLMGSGRWSWWTSRRSGGRRGWCCTSAGGAARGEDARRAP